jgi:hypothetical protein
LSLPPPLQEFLNTFGYTPSPPGSPTPSDAGPSKAGKDQPLVAVEDAYMSYIDEEEEDLPDRVPSELDQEIGEWAEEEQPEAYQPPAPSQGDGPTLHDEVMLYLVFYIRLTLVFWTRRLTLYDLSQASSSVGRRRPISLHPLHKVRGRLTTIKSWSYLPVKLTLPDVSQANSSVGRRSRCRRRRRSISPSIPCRPSKCGAS